jgi:hypothetical protein
VTPAADTATFTKAAPRPPAGFYAVEAAGLAWLAAAGPTAVDSTYDFALVISHLSITTTVREGRAEIRVGLYRPQMPVIDNDLTQLSDVMVHLSDGRSIAAAPTRNGVNVATLGTEDLSEYA